MKTKSRALSFLAAAVMAFSGAAYLPMSVSAATSTTNYSLKSMSSCSVNVASSSYKYNGIAVKPSVTVKYGTKVLRSGTDYTLSYSNNNAVGRGIVSVKGKGAYTGSKAAYFTIYAVKAPTSVKASSSSSSKVSLSWGAGTAASGYYVQRYDAAKKAYTTIKATTSTSYTDSSLKENTAYKYRVLAYRKVGTKTYTSASSVVSAKTLTLAKEYQDQVLSLINAERKKAGLTALKSNAVLDTVALKRSAEIKVEFSHSYKGTKNRAGTWLNYYKFRWNTWGENIAAGQKTPKDVVKAWMNSPSHKANILSAKFKQTGIAYNGRYWVQIFTN